MPIRPMRGDAVPPHPPGVFLSQVKGKGTERRVMKLVHISDIHLTIPGERMGGLNPHRRLAQALEDIAAHHSDAVRIVVTGDLTHWGEPRAYGALRDMLADVAVPVRLLIGNHDDRAAFLEAFPAHPRDEAGYVNYSETVEGQHLIYLDSCAPRTHEGFFCEDRQAWLRNDLEQAENARIFMHHNPMYLGCPAEDKIALNPRDRAAFKGILEAYRHKIDYIHFGHVHAPVHGSYCGIPFASVPSTGNQSLPDFQDPDLLKGAPLPPAYAVVLIDDAGTCIHQIPFTYDGPVFTAGTAWEDWAKPVAAE